MPVPPVPDPVAIDAATVEALLRDGATFPAARVRSVRAERIGVGFGLDGVIARLHVEGDGVPPTLVAKRCARKEADREAFVLRHVAPRIDAALPVLHGVAPSADDRSLLLLEDIHPATQGDTAVGATPQQAAALADAEAAFHGAFWGRTEDPALAALPVWGSTVRDEPARTAAALPRFTERFGHLLPERGDVTGRLPDLLPDARRRLAAAPVTLIHADLHIDNVLFRPGGTPVLLDWSAAARGPAAADVAMLLTQCVDVPTRRAHGAALVARHAAALVAWGVTEDDARSVAASVADAIVVLYAGVVRWGARDDFGEPRERILAIVTAIARQSAAAAAAALAASD